VAGGGLALLLGAVVLAATSKHGGKDGGRTVAIASPPPAVVTPAVLAPPPLPPAPPPSDPVNGEKPSEDPPDTGKPSDESEDSESKTTSDRSSDSESEPTARPRSARGSGGSAAENRRQLEEAERLLRAERFAEARGIFTRLAKSRRDRGPALTGLAEISFQEKHYEEAVRSATRAADRGGGARARVLLGDAHFRLNQFKEAAKAYEGALKLDPKNASARSGLALANKRM
jgi:predicted Zn-dependent protease